MDRFATTVFNNSGKFPAISSPAAHIHLKEGATPKAKHNPILVPYHYKEEVEKVLWDDVKRGIIAPVPIGTPHQTQKNGPRCHGWPLFNPSRWGIKTPYNLYHGVGSFHVSQDALRILTSGNVYTCRYDEIIKDFPSKSKSSQWHTTPYIYYIKTAFYQTLDYLSPCEKNGIVLNKDKFQFCQDEVQFGGLQITSSRVTSSENLLNAISNFPTTKNITDARSWFGLVNQVAWAYSLSFIMLPFWDLIKQNTLFMEWKLRESISGIKKNYYGLSKEGCYHVRYQ